MGKHLNSPFAIKGELHQVSLFNFSLDPIEVEGLAPAPLAPVIHRDRAWLSIVSVRLRHMRPALWPFGGGVNYHHLGYRLLVDCPSASGPQRGIYFLESYCPHRALAWLGNLMTAYAFQPAAFHHAQNGTYHSLEIHSGTHRLATSWKETPGGLVAGSHLKSVAEGLELVGPLTQAFAVAGGNVSAVRISRQSWPLEVVQAIDARTSRFHSAVLEFVARVPGVIPYTWASAVTV